MPQLIRLYIGKYYIACVTSKGKIHVRRSKYTSDQLYNFKIDGIDPDIKRKIIKVYLNPS